MIDVKNDSRCWLKTQFKKLEGAAEEKGLAIEGIWNPSIFSIVRPEVVYLPHLFGTVYTKHVKSVLICDVTIDDDSKTIIFKGLLSDIVGIAEKVDGPGVNIKIIDTTCGSQE